MQYYGNIIEKQNMPNNIKCKRSGFYFAAKKYLARKVKLYRRVQYTVNLQAKKDF